MEMNNTVYLLSFGLYALIGVVEIGSREIDGRLAREGVLTLGIAQLFLWVTYRPDFTGYILLVIISVSLFRVLILINRLNIINEYMEFVVISWISVFCLAITLI